MKEIKDLLKAVAVYYSDKIDDWVMRLHQPWWMPSNSAGPVVCKIDKRLWPCKEYLEALERLSPYKVDLDN